MSTEIDRFKVDIPKLNLENIKQPIQVFKIDNHHRINLIHLATVLPRKHTPHPRWKARYHRHDCAPIPLDVERTAANERNLENFKKNLLEGASHALPHPTETTECEMHQPERPYHRIQRQ
ncbi:hypothetical protein ALQ55_200163 [Pseudomonas savastanoi pv. savastanoi]|nr:hypothetical protein ALQ55_200163 [Pseudomonas savastanoi pv. savastanoi]